jgi:hypothetical protein
LAVVLACSFLLAGTAGAAVGQKAKKVAVEKYAKTVCGSYTKLETSISDFVSSYNGIDATDNPGLQTAAIDLANGLLDDINAQQKKLKKSYPDVDGGKKIMRLFIANVGELEDEVTGAVEDLQAADATSPAFIGDITQFEVSFNVLSARLSDPFSDIDDQDLLKAFDETKICEDVVTVFGV